MSTTSLAVELLLIGYQTIAWLLLLAALTPFYNHAILEALKDWKELIFIASLALAYTLGAITNGIVSKIFNWIEAPLIYKHEKPSEMRAAILVHNPDGSTGVILYQFHRFKSIPKPPAKRGHLVHDQEYLISI